MIVVVVRSGSGGGGLHRGNCRCGKLLCIAVVEIKYYYIAMGKC